MQFLAWIEGILFQSTVNHDLQRTVVMHFVRYLKVEL